MKKWGVEWSNYQHNQAKNILHNLLLSKPKSYKYVSNTKPVIIKIINWTTPAMTISY